MSYARAKLEEHLRHSEEGGRRAVAPTIVDEYATRSARSPFVLARMAIDGWELGRLNRQNGAQALISAMNRIEEALHTNEALMDIVVRNTASDIGWYNTQLASAQNRHSRAKSRNAHKSTPRSSLRSPPHLNRLWRIFSTHRR